MRYIVAVSGASGSLYALRLMETLGGDKDIIISETAKAIFPAETGMDLSALEKHAANVYSDGDLFAPPASGSCRYDAMIIAPCSESTVAKIACGIADTLIARAASVSIKEGRKLVLMVRESPKSAIMLENELKLARLGAVIMDANPGFYPKPETVQDIVDIVVGRCLDQIGAENNLYRRWGNNSE